MKLFVVVLVLLCSHELKASMIGYDTTVVAEIEPAGEIDSYIFEGTAGEHITIRAIETSNDDMGCKIELYAPSGKLEISGYSSSYNYEQVKISNHKLLESGIYTIHLSDYSGSYAGSYNLNLSCFEYSAANAPLIYYGSLVPDSAISPKIDIDHFRFYAIKGDKITISAKETSNDDMGCKIELYAPSGKLEISDYSSSSIYEQVSIDNHIIEETGIYVINISDYSGRRSSTYWLSLQSPAYSYLPFAYFEASNVSDADWLFTASGSYSQDHSALKYRWDFDGNGWDTDFSESNSATHSYTAPGKYLPVLEVIDENSFSSEFTRELCVLGIPDNIETEVKNNNATILWNSIWGTGVEEMIYYNAELYSYKGNEFVLDSVYTTHDTCIVFSDMPNGIYKWRVRASDGKQSVSGFSSFSVFSYSDIVVDMYSSDSLNTIYWTNYGEGYTYILETVNDEGETTEIYRGKENTYIHENINAFQNINYQLHVSSSTITITGSVFRNAIRTPLYVTENGKGSKDGSSWENALPGTQLQQAIDHRGDSGGGQIWVASGTYKPTTGTDRTISFHMRDYVAIYGGFEGYESNRENIDWYNKPTILSGDIGTLNIDSDNSYSVIRNTTKTLNKYAVLDGFYIIKGRTSIDDVDFDNGGGVYSWGGVFRNCSFTDNYAKWGGGAAADWCLFEQCLFYDNEAINSGGAVYLWSGSIKNCKAWNNNAEYGCFYLHYSGTVSNCLVAGNNSAGIYCSDIFDGTIINCAVTTNSEYGIYNGKPEIINTVVWQNSDSEIYSLNDRASVNYCAVEGGYSGTGAGNGIINLSSDNFADKGPQFIDHKNGNYTVFPTSPLIDAGIYTTAVPETDMAGQIRFFGQSVDIGPWESGIEVKLSVLGSDGAFLPDAAIYFNEANFISDKNGDVFFTAIPGKHKIEATSFLYTDTAKKEFTVTDIPLEITVRFTDPLPFNILYVTENGAGEKNGSSWENATDNLQWAIDNVEIPGAIWVANGILKPETEGLTDARDASFSMRNFVEILGGFTGTESKLSQRNIGNTQSILSGDIGFEGLIGDNCYHIINNTEEQNLNHTAILNGFIVENGYGGIDDKGYGAIYSHGGSFQNCEVRFNSNYVKGAGLYVTGSLIQNCNIHHNETLYDKGYGGGIYAVASEIRNSSIRNNLAYSNGGIIVFDAKLIESEISDNHTFSLSEYGTGLYSSGCFVTRCVFYNNADTSGTGGNGVIYLDNKNQIINTAIFNNSSGIYTTNGSETELSNCNLINNNGYGLDNSGMAIISNSIIWGNSSSITGNVATVNFTAIQGGYNGQNNINLTDKNDILTGPNFSKPTTFSGIAKNEQQLNEFGSANWRLSINSPCIDAGLNSIVEPYGYDLVGNNRIIGEKVDMGAYEFGTTGLDLGEDITICDGESITLRGDLVADSYLWNTGDKTSSISVTKPGIYTLTATVNDENHTDSISVNVESLPKAVIYGNDTLCEGGTVQLVAEGGDSYLWNTGATTATVETVLEKTTEFSVTVTKNGCSATASHSIQVNPKYDISSEVKVPYNQSYEFGQQTLTESGEYKQTFRSVHGCDSTVTLTFRVLPQNAIVNEISETACGTFYFKGTELIASGEYRDTLQTTSGTDSIVVLDLTIYPVYDVADKISVPEGESYEFGLQTLTESGEYSQTFRSVHGCDSTVTLTFRVLPQNAIINEISETACGTFYFKGTELIASGEYRDTLQTTSGTDSIVVLDLTIYPVYDVADKISVPEGESYEFGQQTLTESGEYSQTFRSVHGCDSTVTLTFRVLPLNAIVNEISETACGTFYFKGTELIASGEYRDTLQTTSGTDSIVVLILTIAQSYESEIQKSILAGDSLLWEGSWYKTAGAYSMNYTSVEGCDSILKLQLTVLSANALKTSLVRAKSIIDSAHTGTEPGQYSAEAKENLVATVDSLEKILRSSELTQADVDQINNKLVLSIATFEKSRVPYTVTIIKKIGKQTIQITDIPETISFEELFESDGELSYHVISSDQTVVQVKIDEIGFNLVQIGQGTAIITVEAKSSETSYASQSFTVTVETDTPTHCNPFTVSADITNNNCYGEKKGSVAITVSGGTEPYTYMWSTGRSDNLIANKASGTYSVVITDAQFCSEQKEFTISEPQKLIASIKSTDPSCGDSNGSVELTATGGVAPYSYIWADGNISDKLSDLEAGVYSATVTDSKGCVFTKKAELNNAEAPIINLESVVASKCKEGTGEIRISVSNGTEPYTFSWSDGANSKDRTALVAGAYSMTITDATGCKATVATEIKTVTVQINPICVATVSLKSGTNHVIWKKQQSADEIEKYKIYCERTNAGVYDLIGSVPYDSLSVFEDTEADPHSRSWRYKISAVDHCGNESELSDEHKTINLQKGLGLNGEINLTWDFAEGINIPSYIIFRQSTSNGLEELTALPSTLNRYIDFTPPSDVINYYIGVELPSDCEGLKTDSGPFSHSISNIAEIELETKMTKQQKFKVYPQPIEDELCINTSNDTDFKVSLYSIHGIHHITFNARGNTTFKVSTLPTGTYLLKITSGNESVTKIMTKK